MNIEIELNKLYHYLHGAHHATNDENCSFVLHTACHKVEEIINNIKLRDSHHWIPLPDSPTN